MFFVFKSGSADEGECSGGLGDCTSAHATIEDALISLGGLSGYDLRDVEILDGVNGRRHYFDDDGQHWAGRL